MNWDGHLCSAVSILSLRQVKVKVHFTFVLEIAKDDFFVWCFLTEHNLKVFKFKFLT